MSSFEGFIKNNLVKSRFEEVEVPFARPKTIYRFRPLGSESNIATGVFDQIVNRTLYLSFKYLWFPTMPQPKNRSFIDVTDGSFNVTKSSEEGLFYVEDTVTFKLFYQAGHYLDLDYNNKGLEPDNFLHLNNVKYLLSDFHMTTFVFLSVLQEYMQNVSPEKQAKVLGYLYSCNQADYVKTLGIGAPIAKQIQKILDSAENSKEPLSLLPLAGSFVSAGKIDKSLPIKLSLIIRLFIRAYSHLSDGLNDSAKALNGTRKGLYDDVVLGQTLSAKDLTALEPELAYAKDVLKDMLSILYSNLKMDLANDFVSGVDTSKINLNKLKGTLGFLAIDNNVDDTEINPILRNDCFYFEDTIVANRIWAGEGENVFEETVNNVGGASFWDVVNSINVGGDSQNKEKLDDFIDTLVDYTSAGLLSNQFVSNVYKLYIPENIFLSVVGTEKPKSFEAFKQQAYKIAQGMGVLKDTKFMQELKRKFEETNAYLGSSVRLYNSVEQNLARVKRTLDKLEKSKVQDESTKKAIAFLKQTIARETFDLYSLKYEIKQRSAYIQKQGFDLSDTVRKFNPKKDALGTLPAWLTAKAVALILVCLVVVLASVWFFFIHESPAKRVLTNLQNELEEVRDRLKDQCAGRNDKYCDTLADRAKELQELVDKAREEVAKEKNVIETISNEAVTTITTFGELSKYALYGVFGLGVLWGAVKAIDIVKKRNAQENEA